MPGAGLLGRDRRVGHQVHGGADDRGVPSRSSTIAPSILASSRSRVAENSTSSGKPPVHDALDRPVVAEHDQRAGVAAQDPLQPVAQRRCPGRCRPRVVAQAGRVVGIRLGGGTATVADSLVESETRDLTWSVCRGSSEAAAPAAHGGSNVDRPAAPGRAPRLVGPRSAVRPAPGGTGRPEAQPRRLGRAVRRVPRDPADLTGQPHLADRDEVRGQRLVLRGRARSPARWPGRWPAR